MNNKIQRTIQFLAALSWLMVAVPSATAQSVTFTTVYSFSGPDGSDPIAPSGLIQAPTGDLYGTTAEGGTDNNGGTLYRLTLAGSLTTLFSFHGTGAANLQPAWPVTVLMGKDGSLYGTTEQGGVLNDQNSGTIFKYAPDGTMTTIYTYFAVLLTGLIQGSDGNFYGLAYDDTIGGTVFYQVTPAGAFTALNSFTCSCEFGPIPNGFGLLVEGAPLTFYGGYGDTMFAGTSTGTTTTLVSFPQFASPGGLTQGPDKAFYGVTANFGANGLGMVYRMTADGTWTFYHSFSTGTDGAHPNTPPVFGPDGTLYGLAPTGGTVDMANCAGLGCGIIYSVSPSGVYKTLYHFSGGANGGNATALIVGSDGALYGTTPTGGAFNMGSVFRLQLNAAPPPSPGTGGGSGGGELGWPFIFALASLTLAHARHRTKKQPPK
jgi:uncharacterized repeat protein (TIGR03803 family)